MKTKKDYNWEVELGKLGKVEASDFIYTRVMTQLRKQEELGLSPAWKWSLALSFLLIFGLNFLAFKISSNVQNDQPNLVEELNLVNQNNFY